MKNKQSQSILKSAADGTQGLQSIDGGRVKPRPHRLELDSLAARFLHHDAHLFPLALKSGISQHEIAWLAVAMARAEAFENGQRAERVRRRLMPPERRAA